MHFVWHLHTPQDVTRNLDHYPAPPPPGAEMRLDQGTLGGRPICPDTVERMQRAEEQALGGPPLDTEGLAAKAQGVAQCNACDDRRAGGDRGGSETLASRIPDQGDQ